MLYLTFQNEAVPLTDELTIGRSKSDVVIEDSKVSSLHAKVVKTSGGQWNLVDLNSRNGIIVNGKKLHIVRLSEGVSFSLGNTVFKVINKEEPVSIQPTDWKSKLKFHLATAIPAVIPSEKPNIIPFARPVRLNFRQGIQTDTEWVLGYGPRFFGASAELEILELGAPDLCFSLQPEGKHALFKTSYPDIIRLNNQATPADKLKDGDFIVIGNTKIVVTYMKETRYGN